MIFGFIFVEPRRFFKIRQSTATSLQFFKKKLTIVLDEKIIVIQTKIIVVCFRAMLIQKYETIGIQIEDRC